MSDEADNEAGQADIASAARPAPGAYTVADAVAGPQRGVREAAGGYEADAVTSTANMEPTRIRGANGGTLTPFDSQRSAEANRKRWDTAERRARLKLGELAGGSWLDAQDQAIGHVWDEFVATGDHHKAAWLLKTAGAVRPASDQKQIQAAAPGGASLHLDAGAVRELLSLLREQRQGSDAG